MLCLVALTCLAALSVPGIQLPSTDALDGRALVGGRPTWELQNTRRLAPSDRAPLYNDVAAATILEVERVRDELGLYGQGQVVAIVRQLDQAA